jgi:hypothetical protein
MDRLRGSDAFCPDLVLACSAERSPAGSWPGDPRLLYMECSKLLRINAQLVHPLSDCWLVRFVESPSKKYLLLAGICCGAAILAKISGLFAVAAGLLFLLYHDQVRSQKRNLQARSCAVGLVSTVIVAAYCAMVALILGSSADVRVWVNLFLPTLTVALFLSWNEWKNGRGQLRERAGSLIKDVVVFVVGVAIPVTVFLIPYAITESFEDVVHGVFILPFQRLQNAAVSFPPFLGLFATIPMVFFLFGGWKNSKLDDRDNLKITLCVFAFITVAIALSGNWGVHRFIWLSVRLLPPLAIAAAAVFLVRHTESVPEEKRELIVLFMLGTAVLSMIQFPYAEDIYFCYFAPLLILMVSQFRSAVAGRVYVREVGILLFFLFFAVTSLNHCYLARDRFPEYDSVPMSLSRAAMNTRTTVANEYQEVVNIIQNHSSPGDAIYAAPDCPEIYFLADRRNPTRTMYDFFDAPEGRVESLTAMLDDQRINVVVVNMFPEFSEKMDKRLENEVIKRLPQVRVVGRFIVAVRVSDVELSHPHTGHPVSKMVTAPTSENSADETTASVTNET